MGDGIVAQLKTDNACHHISGVCRGIAGRYNKGERAQERASGEPTKKAVRLHSR